MNPLQPRRRHRLSHVLFALLVAALPLAATVPTLLWQERQDLQANARQQVSQAMELVEGILDQADHAARVLLPLAGGPCEQAVYPLRRQVAVAPFVRSAALLIKDRVYCSALSGSTDWALPRRDFVDGRIQLLAGNSVTPDVPLLYYRVNGKRGDAVAAVDGRYLQLALQDASDNDPVLLQVGGLWLGPHQVGTGQPPANWQQQVVRRSGRYPFLIRSGYDIPPWHRLLWARHALLAAVLFLLGLLAGGTLYWLLSRPASFTGELRRALANDEFVGYLQPLVRPGMADWRGAEVLMRWDHPREGLIRPDLFIPRAEESGLIVEMTRRMMDAVIAKVAKLSLPEDFHLGVNISPAHLREGNLIRDCRRWLDRLAGSGAVLALELTEREMVEITPEVEALFHSLDQMGVKVALDDFGTGHSSLVYLQQLTVDGLKIDQSFVAGIGSDGLSAHIVDSVAELAAKLGLATVAEGVETAEQYDYLSRLGVRWLQGFYIARPMPLDEFVRRMRQGGTWQR
ncbi:cyclic diguanylate phosphodiesterase [Chromobacterium phragmitis]|uniref:EAL domain-containing protein n=1 Tax=Chromobacterium phragmitis TaxID=2202141 RepID=UPI000DEC66DE|nr:cyclic diguanylate phosphodiesterase [Chromobacterium phragmitis]AXE29932.1 cyclic diguanylate phosphodiesterase [Chromobacterium phragmitis]